MKATLEKWADERSKMALPEHGAYDKNPHRQSPFAECYDALQAAVAEVGQSDRALDERTAQYHLVHAKVLSREAIIEQLSDTELAKDVTRLEAEVERLREAVAILPDFVRRFLAEDGGPKASDD